MAATAPGGVPATYTYSSKPKAVTARKKYRDPNESFQDDANAINIMYDKRVFRGNTYRIAPGAGAPADAPDMMTMKEKMLRQQAATREKHARIQAEKDAIYTVQVPPSKRVEVDLTPYLVEQSTPVPEKVVETQTDEFLPRPPTPPYVPKKTGIDAYTQIEEGELFDFDLEVEPIVDVLVFKTLEQSLLEVEEEEELRAMREYKAAYAKRVKQDKEKVSRMEKKEKELYDKIQARMAKERIRVEEEKAVLTKLAAFRSAHNYLSGVTDSAVKDLSEGGFFASQESLLVETHFFPWLFKQVESNLRSLEGLRDTVDSLISVAVEQPRLAYQETRRKREEEERQRELERERNRVKRGNVRIYVNSETPIGPISVTNKESVEDLEQRVAQWLVDNAPELAEQMPHGVILLYNGEPLESTAQLFTLSADHLGSVEMKAREPPSQEGAEEEATG
eukprot:GILI01012779.1.p1 GENE.GILI01012779.1~~GILI01012779.1.p1  ORF type:complete len:449 (-),score=121.42 GILI01012779.1:14-1360(-)